MKPEIISTIAAVISALAAISTVYLYRSQGKGFVWTKDPKVELLLPDPNKLVIRVSIPLFNFGHGNIRFLSLNAKRILLKNNSIDPYKINMDEAYFPSGVRIITYNSSWSFEIKPSNNASPSETHIIVSVDPNTKLDQIKQNTINENLKEMGEILFILKCKYKDGSWLGYGVRTTTIALSLKEDNLNYLSIERRKQLDELFQFK